MFIQNRNRLTDIENRLVVAKGEVGGVGWTDREFGFGGYRLFHLEWTSRSSRCGAVVNESD